MNKLQFRIKIIRALIWFLIFVEAVFIIDHYRMSIRPVALKASVYETSVSDHNVRRKFKRSVTKRNLTITLADGKQLVYSSSIKNVNQVLTVIRQTSDLQFLVPAIKFPYEKYQLIGLKTDSGYSLSLLPAWMKFDYRLFFPPLFILICIVDLKQKRKALLQMQSEAEAPQKIFY